MVVKLGCYIIDDGDTFQYFFHLGLPVGFGLLMNIMMLILIS